MKQRKYVVFTLVIVMMAFMVLSVSTVLAGDFDSSTASSEEHPPVCVKGEMPPDAGPWVLMECTDAGEDISNVSVKANTKYELEWNAAHVVLWVYADDFTDVAFWVVEDKAGSVVSGRLP